MNQETIDQLDELAGAYGLELHMPPLDSNLNPFFYIGEIKNDAIQFREFFIQLDRLDINFKYFTINGKKDYLELTS